jgi:hypothetical protein
MRTGIRLLAVLGLAFALSNRASADPFFFSTGNPDGKMASLSRIAGPLGLETETADDFATTASKTTITDATFTGLLVGGATPTNINNNSVEIELYHVFPIDSDTTRTPNVVTRVNSPSDNNFAAADGKLGQLSVTTTVLNQNFTAANSVVNNIKPAPMQTTGGEGPVTGIEVQLNIHFNTPFVLGPDHVFFRPEVDLGSAGNFLWLSAPRPIVPPGTPFPAGVTDLQAWIRTDGNATTAGLAPDWSRIGQDIVGPAVGFPTFNETFSLTGTAVPEPSSLMMMSIGGTAVCGICVYRRRRGVA